MTAQKGKDALPDTLSVRYNGRVRLNDWQTTQKDRGEIIR